MQVFGKKFSNWWLLVLQPILLLCSPVLLILFFAANNFAGAIIGPPAIMEPYAALATARGSRRPLRGVGTALGSAKIGPDAALDLGNDGSMSVRACRRSLERRTARYPEQEVERPRWRSEA